MASSPATSGLGGRKSARVHADGAAQRRGSASRRRIVVSTLLVVATLATYWPVLRSEFISLDDNLYVTANNRVQRGLTLDGVRWAFVNGEAALWLPLTWLSHMLDCQLFEMNPTGHHLTNLLLHAANVVLLLVALERMTGAPWRSAVVAGLFALHPLRVESVAWVAERKDVLSTFFGLLTLAAYARYAQQPAPRRLGLVATWFALGLLAKPMLVTLPFVLLLLDYWPLGRVERWRWRVLRRLVGEKLPLFGLAAAACVVTILIARGGGAVVGLEEIALPRRIANALVAYAGYLGMTLWPSDLAVFYPMPAAQPASSVAGAALVLLGLTGVAVLAGRRLPYLPVGWLWFVGTLVPVSGIVQAGDQAMADRFTYLPHVGLFLAGTWGTADLLERRRAPRLLRTAGASAVLGVLTVCTFRQLGYWRNSETLFTHALRVTSGNWVAHSCLGDALVRRGSIESAMGHFVEAIRLKPSYGDAHYNLGVVHGLQGRLDQAAQEFVEAIRIEPRFADAHYNLGAARHKQGRIEEAVAHYREALRLKPDYAEAHYSLAVALAKQGHGDEATRHYAEALRLKPDLPRVQ